MERTIGGEADLPGDPAFKSGVQTHGKWATATAGANWMVLVLILTIPVLSCPGRPLEAEQNGLVHFPWGIFVPDVTGLFASLWQQQHAMPVQQHRCCCVVHIDGVADLQDRAAKTAGCVPARRSTINMESVFIIDISSKDSIAGT